MKEDKAGCVAGQEGGGHRAVNTLEKSSDVRTQENSAALNNTF